MSWGGAIFDLTIFGWLTWRRSRPFAYAAVVGFHLMTGVLFQIGMFPWIMIVATTVFFEPSWPRRWTPQHWWPSSSSRPSEGLRPAASSTVVYGLALHLAVQLLLPLRALAYPGRTAWHEQGFRFGWRVMLIEKTGMVQLRVRDPATGRRWRIDPHDDLTALQVKMMSTQPHMILAYVHVVAERFAQRGIGPVEVYVDAWASLNGRRSRRLVDPDVDLAQQRDTLAPKPWIVPFVDSRVP